MAGQLFQVADYEDIPVAPAAPLAVGGLIELDVAKRSSRAVPLLPIRLPSVIIHVDSHC